MATEDADELQMEVDWLKGWAADHKVIFEDKGEVGFGRPCVGMMARNGYIDLGPPTTQEIAGQSYTFPQPAEGSAPPGGVNAYHKHECLTVLARTGPDGEPDYDAATHELFVWVQSIDKAGLIVKSAPRDTGDPLTLMLHGPTIYYLEKP